MEAIHKDSRATDSVPIGASTAATVCIVTPANLCSNPRVVKEADALHEAGLRVEVVFAQNGIRGHDAYDRAIVASRGWTATPVTLPTRKTRPARWLHGALTQRLCQLLPMRTWPYADIAERGEGMAYHLLARAALQIEADLFIGHYAEGLAAAGAAARRRQVLLAFDAEDFHTGEANPAAKISRIDFIQRRYLPRCAYITAASGGIADALAGAYDIPLPTTIHNTFSWSDRQLIDRDVLDRRGRELSLYWYSQVIGLDRGLQDAIRALGLLRGPAQLHLRGAIADETRTALLALATDCGVRDQIHFHEPIAPDALLSRAVEHDIGLALEQGTVFNRAICATNKLFFFMLAGLAIAATDVPGQAKVLSHDPDAGYLYPPGDHVRLADLLERWRSSPEALARAKRASLEAARSHWNWESEAKRLREVVQRSIRGVRNTGEKRRNASQGA